jgi:ectoine hydroxylase-related dioxygenase (phytanoyl-CoA dioxygenase family)
MRNYNCQAHEQTRCVFLFILSLLVASAKAFHLSPLVGSPDPATTINNRVMLSRIGSSSLKASSTSKNEKPPNRRSPPSRSKVNGTDEKPPNRRSPAISRSKANIGTGAAATAKSKKRSRKPDLATQLDYARNGHAVIRNQLDPALLERLRSELWDHGRKQELQAWRQKVQVATESAKIAASCRTVQDCRKELARVGVPDDYLPFLQYFNCWTSLPSVYNDVVLQLAETAAILMDVDSVRLYQDSLFWKRPGDSPTPWHTDARMAPFDTSNLVTLWIPLQAIPAGGTGLVFCSKSHSDFSLPYWNPLEKANKNPRSPWNDLEERYRRDQDDNDDDDDDRHLVDYMPLQTGDVTAHAGWTLHCANGNLEKNKNAKTKGGHTDHDRLALAVTYVDARAVVRKDALTSSIGDNEDVWSYRDWVGQVPARTRNFVHKRVPIVWPPAP